MVWKCQMKQKQWKQQNKSKNNKKLSLTASNEQYITWAPNSNLIASGPTKDWRKNLTSSPYLWTQEIELCALSHTILPHTIH